MTSSEIVNEYFQKANALIVLLRSIDEKQIFYLPKRFEALNIYQHLSHLILTQNESLNRTLLLLMYSKELCIISENIKWSTIANDTKVDTQKSIVLFESLVTYEIALLKKIELHNMEKMNIQCKYHGEIINMNLLENIESSIYHIDFHSEYINGIIIEYNTERTISNN